MKRISVSITRRFAVDYLNKISDYVYVSNIGHALICEALINAKLVDAETPTSQKGRRKLLDQFYKKHNHTEKKKTHFRPKKNQIRNKEDFFNSWEWTTLRYKALALHGRRCMCCGSSPADGKTILHVDHIKPRSKYPELEFELDNLQVLCSFCNKGKGAWDETDFRSETKVINGEQWDEILIAQSARTIQ